MAEPDFVARRLPPGCRSRRGASERAVIEASSFHITKTQQAAHPDRRRGRLDAPEQHETRSSAGWWANSSDALGDRPQGRSVPCLATAKSAPVTTRSRSNQGLIASGRHEQQQAKGEHRCQEQP